MVRTTKTEKQSTPAPVANVVVEQSAAKKSKKTSKEAAPAPVAPAPVVEAAPAAEPVESTENTASVKLSEFGARLQQLTTMISALKTEYKTLEKVMARELKNAQKSSSRKRKSGNRQPSGFVKPARISDELAEFLGKSIGTEMARTDVSKEINKYIRANKLQDPANGRNINPDTKLAVLLKLKSGEELTYFNLQKYMKHHFVKATATA
jgi:chromatin remodeling complex protein RSC6